MSLRSGQPSFATADSEGTSEQKIAALKARLGAVPPGSGRPVRQRPLPLAGKLKKLIDHPYILVVIVLLGWGVSEYLLVLTGRAVNWQTGMFYNCIGVVTVNLVTFQSGNINLFRFDKWVGYAILTGVLYGGADIYFLKLSGNKNISHMADVSVLAPLCALYILIPTLLGIFVDREPLTKRKALGIVLATMAILILSFEEQEEESSEGEAAVAGVDGVDEQRPTNFEVGSYPRIKRSGSRKP